MGKDKKEKDIDIGGESTSTRSIPNKSAVHHQTPRSLISLENYLKTSPTIASNEDISGSNIEAENAFVIALEETYQKIKNNRKWYSKALNALLFPINYCQQVIRGPAKKYDDLSTAEKQQLFDDMSIWNTHY